MIYADPPWEYRQHGTTAKSRGNAAKHYQTMTTEDICKLPVRKICGGGQSVSCGQLSQTSRRRSRSWRRGGSSTKPLLSCGSKRTGRTAETFGAWAPTQGQTRRFACWGVSQGLKARERVRSHRVHQVIEAPFEGHSKKPDETRRRIVELLGDVPRLELFARDRAPGWDAWGNEVPPAE